jgi:nitrate reductase gamma subunit
VKEVLQMESWLAFARGPFFRFTFAVMVLGLARHAVVAIWSLADAYRRSSDKDVSWARALWRTVSWLLPVGHLRQRWAYSAASVVFHVGAILAPLFFAGHIRMLHASTGVAWAALPMPAVDVLTLVTLGALLGLLLGRVGSRPARSLSRGQDLAIPLLLAVPFASGFLATHTGLNPFPYEPTLLVHMLSAGACFLVIPFTKLAHMVLMPLSQVPSELGWRFPANYPERVSHQLGREHQPI